MEVFQPFELVAGGDLLQDVPIETKGRNRVDLKLLRFPAGAMVAFTVDVDATLSGGELDQIRVSGGETVGAELQVGSDRGIFDIQGRAKLAKFGCSS